jgi:hypothetical protein
MNADQLIGFNMALACLMRWGSQIERNGISLGGPQDPIPRSQMMRHSGKMVRSCAEALALTIGRAPAQIAPTQTDNIIPIATAARKAG